MNTLNYMFFEEFKKLDKICKEIYNSEVGVTNYIKDMQSVPRNKYLFIKNFELDLKYLIRFRHIRNHLAHSEGGFDEKVCTEEDIVLIKNFHKRILTCSDPIALVLKNEKYQKNILHNNITKYSNINTISTKQSALYAKQKINLNNKITKCLNTSSSPRKKKFFKVPLFYWVIIVIVILVLLNFLKYK